MKYLFLVNIGPVQSFIASARRTRDLWFGSWFLSELAKAAAQEIVNNRPGNSLIFPAPPNEQLQELLKEGSELNVANKIIALVDASPQQVGEIVHKAIVRRLQTIKGQAFQNIGPYDQVVADTQIDDLVEYFWVTLPFNGTNYATTRKNLEALMAARKNTRDFKEVGWGSSKPKSSIDGQLESVIPEDFYQRRGISADQRQSNIDTLYKKYKAGPAERLSGVDLLKRRGNPGGEEHFFSTSHMAAIPFLKRLDKLKHPAHAKELFDKYVAKILEIAASQKQIPMLDRIPKRYPPHIILGNYDGSLLFEERLVDIVADTTGFEPAKEALRAFYKEVDEALGKARPLPYYAILRADGDFMGQTIDEQSRHEQGTDRHCKISQALDGFAREVHKIVEKDHAGALVYAGGDDVLALMPLHTVLACAKELAKEFAERLTRFKYGEDHSPTLSVGIAVVHHLDSLREALDLARSAEEEQAKGVPGKNALAIRVSKRSGEEHAIAGKWGEVDEHLTKLIQFYRGGYIPEGMSYELRTQARRLAGPPDDEDLQKAMLAEAKRIVQRKLSIRQKTRAQQSSEGTEEVVNALLAMLGGENQQEQGQSTTIQKRVEELATELIVARTFADAMALAEPQEKEPYEEGQA
jgi:CRISPR-associated protein Cmr2